MVDRNADREVQGAKKSNGSERLCKGLKV
jgi:hypothetical protein